MQINVVLFAPEIPHNTGNVMRSCMASGVSLHLIEPLGFKLDAKELKRAGLDYLRDFSYKLYSSWLEFIKNNKGSFIFVSRYGKKTPREFDYKTEEENIYLVFGNESKGLPYEILHDKLDCCVRLPMVERARSLNLANCVAIMIYEVLAAYDYLNLSKIEVIKGEDWIFGKKED